MNFIKANLFIILCLAVVALGIGLFVIGYMVRSKTNTGLQEIENKIEEVDRLNNKLVHDDEMARKNENVMSAGDDLQAVLSRIQETTARPLLHPEALDEEIRGADRVIHYERFANRYCQYINELIDNIGGGDKPSEAEEEQRRQEFFGQRSLTGAGAAGSVDQTQINKWLEANRKKRAESITIYATPEAFCCYYHWLEKPRSDDHNEMLSDIWYTQIAGWIQEDVAGVIKQMNGDTKSVYLSPVKRLLSISFGGSNPSGSSSFSSSGTARGRSSSGTGVGGQSAARSDLDTLPCYVIGDATSSDTLNQGMGALASGAGTMGGPPGAAGGPPGAMVGGPPGAMGGPPGAMMGGPPGAMGGPPGTMGMPGATPAAAAGVLAKASPKHVSNSLVNVVQFEINVIIDSAKISEFINTLQSEKQYTLVDQPDDSNNQRNARNQITVLQMEMDPIDVLAENKQGYYYGSASLKKLRLICQYIFFFSGYEDIMPQPIKALFGTL